MPDAARGSIPINQFTVERREKASAASAVSNRNPDKVDHPATSEMIYSDEEVAFMMAGEAWKAKTGRRYPSWSEVLKIAKEIGYTKS